MKVIDPGHTYMLDDNKSPTNTNVLVFMKDHTINGDGYNGTTNQEVLRALIDRVLFLQNQEPSEFNPKIIQHLRAAIVLHEQRHLERELTKGRHIELIPVQPSGHFIDTTPIGAQHV